jgi:sigma-B regulation protein RsbU (phosphoserine phosphatase)
VRAGHEPAIVYDPSTDSFTELLGDGIALGVDENWSYQEQRYEAWTNGRLILIGTDGIWEAENPEGERFGKARLREIIRERRNESSKEIAQAILATLASHRGSAPQQDDITMVVVKRINNQ